MIHDAQKTKAIRTVRTIDREKFDAQLKNVKNKKYRCLFLLMYDAGLRPGEAVRLEIRGVDFRNRTIETITLKKRGDECVTRLVPMTARLSDELSKYYQTLPKKQRQRNDYFFPSKAKNAKEEFASIKVLWRVFKRYFPNNRPHDCRHSFGTNLTENGTNQVTIRDLLGHASIATTEIYQHTRNKKLYEAIETLEPAPSLWQKLTKKYFPQRKTIITSVEKGDTGFIVGRSDEMADLIEYCIKRQNVAIVGDMGLGKSHLMDNLKIPNVKIFRIDDFSAVKETLVNLVIEVLEDKPHLKQTLFGDEAMKARLEKKNVKRLTNTSDEYGKRITRMSIKNLTEILIGYTEKLEYTIMIDDVERVSPNAMKAIKKLNPHFHMIVGYQKLSISKMAIITNYRQVKLKPLTRTEMLELINRLSYSFIEKIEDYEMYKNHIVEQSNGNPKFAKELIESYEKEYTVTTEIIRGTTHTAAYNEIDMTLPLLLFFASFAILRYLGRETGDSSLTFIGSSIMILLILARPMMNAGKRKYV